MTKTRWVPKDARLFHKNEVLNLEVHTYKTNTGNIAIGYYGRQTNPAFHNRYKDDATLREYVSRLETSLEEHRAKIAERRKAVPHDVKVGDIFRASWGYDQTNIDYYQCVGLVGSTMGTFRKIAAQSQEDGFMQGDSVPAVGHFVGEPFRARIRGGDRPAIRVNGHISASRMTPIVVAGVPIFEPSRWTAYA